MHKIFGLPATHYPTNKAAEIAAANNAAEEDGWSYKVEARGDYSIIAVYDETNTLVDYL